MIPSINKTVYRKGESELYVYSSCPQTSFRSTHTLIVAMFQLTLSIKDDHYDDDNEDGLTLKLTLLMTMVSDGADDNTNCDDDDGDDDNAGVECGDVDGDDEEHVDVNKRYPCTYHSLFNKLYISTRVTPYVLF